MLLSVFSTIYLQTLVVIIFFLHNLTYCEYLNWKAVIAKSVANEKLIWEENKNKGHLTNILASSQSSFVYTRNRNKSGSDLLVIGGK